MKYSLVVQNLWINSEFVEEIVDKILAPLPPLGDFGAIIE